MSRSATARPVPLPPDRRTIGQLVAESIRFYQDHFWKVLPLGLAFAVVDQASAGRATEQQVLILGLSIPLITAAYVRASTLVSGARWSWLAFLLGILIFAPVPVLMLLFIAPGIAWLAFMGLAVPVAVIQRTGFRDSLIRGRELGTADYIHSLGSIATLAIVYQLTKWMLAILLQGQADTALRAALFLTDLTLSPLIFVGSALLYFDQEARLRSGPRARS